MESVKEKIALLLEEANLTQNLNSKSAKAYYSALERVAGLESEIEQLQKDLKESHSREKELVKKLENFDLEKYRLDQREKELDTREIQVRENEYLLREHKLVAEHQAQRADDHVNMVNRIFRNSQIREQVMHSTTVPVVTRSQYSDHTGNINFNENVTHEITHDDKTIFREEE